jgi:hypothetical protein
VKVKDEVKSPGKASKGTIPKTKIPHSNLCPEVYPA